MGRAAKGVRGIRLRKGDEVVAAEVAEEKTAILTVAENGFGKRTKIEDYPLQGRGGKGVISIKLTEKGGKVVGLLQVRDEDEVVMITGAGKLIRTTAENISIHGRNTQGVKLMDTADEKISSIAKVVEKEVRYIRGQWQITILCSDFFEAFFSGPTGIAGGWGPTQEYPANQDN